MAPGLTPRVERRHSPRFRPVHTQWSDIALLRPGREVHVINLSSGGVLIESASRLSPGTRAELQLFGTRRRLVGGRIDRCQVSGLTPLAYRGAIVFDVHLELQAPADG